MPITTLVQCNSLGNLGSNRYKSKKGNQYMFHQGHPTPIKDPDDAKDFLSNPNFFKTGTLGEADKVKEKIKEKVTEEKSKIPEEKVMKLTDAQIWDLSKKEQIDKIKKLGGTGFPRLEKEKVAMIHKLQGTVPPKK